MKFSNLRKTHNDLRIGAVSDPDYQMEEGKDASSDKEVAVMAIRNAKLVEEGYL